MTRQRDKDDVQSCKCVEHWTARDERAKEAKLREVWLSEHDAAVRKDEREKVLDEMRDLVRNAKKYGTIEPEELFHYTGLLAMIESLRGGGEP